MARTWGYVIADVVAGGVRFESSTALYNFYIANGIEGLESIGGSHYTYEGKTPLDANLAQLVLQGLAFEDGWQRDGTVSRFFLEGGE